jgi:hypothetical protein
MGTPVVAATLEGRWKTPVTLQTNRRHIADKPQENRRILGFNRSFQSEGKV